MTLHYPGPPHLDLTFSGRRMRLLGRCRSVRVPCFVETTHAGGFQLAFYPTSFPSMAYAGQMKNLSTYVCIYLNKYTNMYPKNQKNPSHKHFQMFISNTFDAQKYYPHSFWCIYGPSHPQSPGGSQSGAPVCETETRPFR